MTLTPHQFLKQVFIDQKQIQKITASKPLIFILQQHSFLQYTIHQTMQHLQIPYLITTLKSSDLEQNTKNMCHEVPCLVFGNQVLETNQLVEFLCDAFIGDGEFIDFQARKGLVKEVVMDWREVFGFEKLWPHDFGKLTKLGVKSKTDYQNVILKSLKNLNVYFEGKLLQKAYAGFSEHAPSLEAIVFVDIIKCILKNIPESYPDYYLRKFYPNLIETHEKYATMIQNSMPRHLLQDHQVVIQSSQQVQGPNIEKFRSNSKRFLLLFGFLTAMYGIYAKS